MLRHAPTALLLTSVIAAAQSPDTERASSNLAGLSAGSASVALSPDGRFVAFVSGDPQVVAGDVNGTWDVFLRDRVLGTTEIVSLGSNGAQGHPVAFPILWEMDVGLAVARDGRQVAFTSSAPDLVPGDINGAIDVFVRDRVLGTTVIASAGPGGAPGNDHAAFLFIQSGMAGAFHLLHPTGLSITPDGRYLAFTSSASNLVAGDTNQRHDVFVRDLQTGLVERVDVSTAGVEGDADCFSPSISADGRYVAFQSGATNLVAGDTNQRGDVFVRDRQLGIAERVSVSTVGAQGDDHSSWYVFMPPPTCHDCAPTLQQLRSVISADGRFVAFASLAANLEPGAAGTPAYVYLHDRRARTTRNLTPLADGGANFPSLSADGRFAALISGATNLGPVDANPGPDVFRLDLAFGTVTLESVDALGLPRPGVALVVALAEDGHQVAFVTDADLAPGGPAFTRPDAYTRGAPANSFAEDCSGSVATCPCANAGASGHGCANSVEPGGARLQATGIPSVASDTLVLGVTGEPATSPTLFLQATTSFPSAGAVLLGDGVRCVDGQLLRLRTRNAEFGRAQLGLPSDQRLSVLGAIPAPGASVHYQAVYRNAAAFCTPSTYNTSNSVAVTWTP